MTRILTLGLVLAGIFTVWFPVPSPAQSRPSCAPRDTVVERLAARYGETRQSIGLGSNNQLMEVYASDDSGSWTITVTNPSGVTCLIASGQAFETLAEQLPAHSDGA